MTQSEAKQSKAEQSSFVEGAGRSLCAHRDVINASYSYRRRKTDAKMPLDAASTNITVYTAHSLRRPVEVLTDKFSGLQPVHFRTSRMNSSWEYWCYVFALSLAITDFVASGTRNNFDEDVDKDAQYNKLEKSGTVEQRFRCVFER